MRLEPGTLSTVRCSCSRKVMNQHDPTRGCGACLNSAWLCAWCKTVVCVDCYATHTEHAHGSRVLKDKPLEATTP